MRLRVIEQQDEYGIHYTPQYFEERRGWCECYLDCNLSHEIYRKPEDAIAMKFNATTQIWCGALKPWDMKRTENVPTCECEN